MNRFFILLSLILALTLTHSGCVSVSTKEQILSSSGEIRSDDPDCNEPAIATHIGTELNNEGFTLVSWNIFKENKPGWKEELQLLREHTDLILLQEAFLTPEFAELLASENIKWEMISAFSYQDSHAGVMTIGSIPALASCAQRAHEPLIYIPKSSLISYFSIKGQQQTLLVANIHAINLTLGVDRFTEQLEEIIAVLAEHQGPIIFAGDFNTWSNQRMHVLTQLTGKLGLDKVEFKGSSPIRFYGQHLDHIFFRGMHLQQAKAIPVDSSDHYPLQAHFIFDKEEVK
jgi:endonuclease/exonuclease/phosphatase (EEP) superfamily protein YafD